MSEHEHLEIIPLGGLGEFGMNFMVYRWGRECVIVDTGMMFPGAEHLGVDVVIPDFSFLAECGTLHGVILTHGHEDHIGALPYLLQRYDLPIYGTPYVAGLVSARLERHCGIDGCTIRPLPSGAERLRLGPFEIETLSAAHSIPEARMIVLHTALGPVVHTADFKLDPNPPDGYGTDVARLAELGREGVLALLSDSTNADRPGLTPGERSVERAIDGLLAGYAKRVLVTTFSSNIPRLQTLTRLARRHGRKIALVGTSLERQAEVAERLGLLSFPVGARGSIQEVMSLPPQRALLVATGTQGEPMSALARIAVGQHRDVALEDGDVVLHSARKIPGNEKSIDRMINHLMRRGAEVVTADQAPIHVSGHPSQEELRLLLQLVRPRFFVPIHGEYRQLVAHARLARDSGLEPDSVLLAESGDVVAIGAEGIEITGRVHVGQVFIDDTLDEVDRAILRDRRRVADDGIVIAVVAVNRDGDSVAGSSEIVTRGFVPDSLNNGELLREARRIVDATLADSTEEERSDEAILKARIQNDLKRFLRRATQRQPLIIPVIVEL